MMIWNHLPGDRLLIDLSLWSARLHALGEDIQRIDTYPDLYHLDVSDDHFVPGLLFFPDLVAALRPLTAHPFHVHLMADHPEGLVKPFLAAGADLITVHIENGTLGRAAIELIRRAGKSAGIALSLEVEPEEAIPYLEIVDLVLMMGTPLGIKGQGLAPQAIQRIRTMRQLIDSHGYSGRVKIFADGGIRQHTVAGLRAAGADGIVPGSLVFGSARVSETIQWLHSLSTQVT